MKKFLSIFVLLIVLFLTTRAHAKTLTFSQAYGQIDHKPMAILVYADWADNYQNHLINFRKTERTTLGQYFNFVELDIASKEAKLFNDKFEIYPQLPYIILLRNNGKVTHYIKRNCSSDTSCIISKMKSFLI